MNNRSDQTCPGCGQGNECAVAAGRSAAACWCMGSTTRLPVPEDDSACYCSTCLHAIAEQALSKDVTTDAS